MNGRLRLSWTVAIGGLLTAAHAVDAPTPDPALTYGPVPGSTLVSRPELPFLVARSQRNEVRTTVLAYQRADGRPEPVAVLTSSGTDARVRVSVQHFAPADAEADVEVAALEHLYVLALREEPDAEFCLTDGREACDAYKVGRSQFELLQALAAARRSAIARAVGSDGVPWGMVSMVPWTAKRADPDEVGVRVATDRGPLVGVAVFFNRAPHSICVGKSGDDGLATCHLVDQHGDGDSHADDEHVPVVATFPGHVSPERVLPPTTRLLDPAP